MEGHTQTRRRALECEPDKNVRRERKTLTNRKSPLEGCSRIKRKKKAAALSPTLPAKDTGPTLLTEYSRAPERAAAPERLEWTWETRAAVGE